MNYTESLSYLLSLGHETLAVKLGLETVRTLARACGDPQRMFPAIHIAGTNGKGSTAAMTESILRAAGYTVGLYTSPHLISITERIRVNGEEITQDSFARLASEVSGASENLVAEGALEAPPTFFEQMTMIAFLYFAERKIEIAVLEVGMGGRLDATNICEPVVTAITPIGYDHQKYLGETLTEIAGEKAGVIRAGVPVIVASQEEEAMQAIAACAEELLVRMISVEEEVRSTKLFKIEAVNEEKNILGIGRYKLHYQTNREAYNVRLGLRGRHQVNNALTAIHVAEQLIEEGWHITNEAIEKGLQSVEWPGRLEMIQRTPESAPILLDGAHNPGGIRALRDFLSEHFARIPITLIFGAMADKAIEEMIEIIFPMAQKIIVTRVKNPRAAEPKSIADMGVMMNREVNCIGESGEALTEALQITPQNGVICVCGSLFLVGEIKAFSN